MNNNNAPLPRWSIGIDGGGTKTLAIIVDEHGNELGRGLSASANHQNVGTDTALAHISDAITLALASAQQHHTPPLPTLPLHSAWFGLAGIDHPSDHTRLFPRLQTFARHVRLTNDAELILSALPDTIGIALIAGTGSIALGRDQHGSSTRAGGWGNIIGDEGSGYDIGRQCLQAITQAADGRAQPTLLTDLVLHHWHLHNPTEIIDIVYKKNDKSTIASLSPLVCSAAEHGDTVARTIITTAALALALTVLAVKKRLDQPPPDLVSPSPAGTDLSSSTIPLASIPSIYDGVTIDKTSPTNLALSGGLLLHEPTFRAHVITAIRSLIPLDTITLVPEPALSAARAALSPTPT